jgi:hypothetical protein
VGLDNGLRSRAMARCDGAVVPTIENGQDILLAPGGAGVGAD